MAQYADKPKIMAIGDSMYQGVRSMSIAADKASNSVPAIVANALGLPMSLPLMHRPILYDLEEMLRQGGLISLVESIRQVALKNVDAWLRDTTWSTEEAFDNLALGGALIDDLWTDNFDVYWDQIAQQRALLATGTNSLTEMAAVIFKLWYALNACFVLNPSRRSPSSQSIASPIQQAIERKPDILLVNIGSNEGLFDAGFTGEYGADAQNSIAAIPGKMTTLANKLTALPPGCKIYVNSIIRPRCISNLYPRVDPSTYPGPDYYPEYIAYLGDGSASLKAADMKAFDAQVLAVNSQSRDAMRAILGDRMVWVDLYTASDLFDGKHYFDRAVAVPSAGIRLRNAPLEIVPLLGFHRGGLTGLDNMHPTVPGYTKIAETVLAAMDPPKALPADAINKAYAADTLMQDLPSSYPFLQLEVALLGSLGLFRGV